MAADAPAQPTGAAAANDRRTISFLIQDLLQTREVRQAVAFLVPELLNLWSGGSALKTMLSQPLGKMICNGIVSEKQRPFPSLSDGTLFAGRLDALASEVSSALFQALDAIVRGLGELPVHRQEKVIGALISNLTGGHNGALVTRLSVMLEKIHAHNPRFLTDAIQPGFRRWVEDMDFGELREALDHSTEEVAAFAKMINDVMWQYPAKLVLALSVLPDLANAAGVVLKESIGRFNQVSPDLVADIVLSLFRQLDGNTLGLCLGELSELIRKIHTGSALIGDPGVPRFVQDLAKLVAEAATHLDGAVVAKAFTALAEDGEVIRRSFVDALQSNPDLWLHQLRRTADRKNPRIRAMGYRLAALAQLPEEAVAGALSEGVAALDCQEAAEVVNLAAALFNRIETMSPETLRILAGQFAEGLDLFEFRAAADNISAALGGTLQPIGRALLPGIIRELCRWMAPADDEYEEDMMAARSLLRSVLLGEEVSA